MPRNHLCPEDYVRFIKKYVKERQGYTKDDIYKYCIANTEFMDYGDENEIKHIINISLEQFGKAIQRKGEKYFTVASVEDVVVEDYPNVKMDLSESIINQIKSIEGNDGRFDFSDASDSKISNGVLNDGIQEHDEIQEGKVKKFIRKISGKLKK